MAKHNIRDAHGKFTSHGNAVLQGAPKRKRKPRELSKPVSATICVGIVRDKSGSMSSLRHAALASYNSLIAQLKAQSIATGQRTLVTVVDIGVGSYNGNQIDVAMIGVPVESVPVDTYYGVQGGTPLLDGVGVAVDYLEATALPMGTLRNNLVIAITDGEENQSRKYGAGPYSRTLDFGELMRSKQALDNWTFTFQVPKGYGARLSSSFGVPSGNITEWATTEAGMSQTTTLRNAAVSNYYAATQSAGASGQSAKSQVFYSSVTTDMGKVAVAAVKGTLDDLSDRFKVLTAEKEVVVKEFVEAKTARPYVVGCAYYQLMKPEKVQPQKGVLIMEKGKKAVWGGQQARDLIGLPKGLHAKVVPGNHSVYDIFVQSASVNRKLPRGTRVLVDTGLTASVTPTWDHTAVKPKVT